jgi:polyhydroxyalkanoate synthesis regulator phasin
MDEPAEPSPRRTLGELVGELLLAMLGAASVTREKVEETIDDLATRGRISREEASRLLDELSPSSARGRRLTERAAGSLSGLFRDLGLATDREYAELELRVAQLEHRLRLLERSEPVAPAPTTEPPPS